MFKAWRSGKGSYFRGSFRFCFEIIAHQQLDSVRVFVKFRKEESAKKAFANLNGRLFGGRVVKAAYYDVAAFDSSKYSEALI